MSQDEKLIPPDLERCQTEWRGGSFMTFGPRPMERCTKKPDWVATEKRKPHGSMSLCQEHREVFEGKYPGQATFKSIAELKPAVCYGCGKDTPPVSMRNVAGDLVHCVNKCMKRAISKRMRELHQITSRKDGA